MTLHTGKTYTQAEVQIGPPDFEAIEAAPQAADVASSVTHWLAEARARTDVYYFSIFLDHTPTPIGEIALHDMNDQTGESLVGYHLFQPHVRGRGVGTKALRLLQHFVAETTYLKRLIIITSRDNIASQSIAQKCGFRYIGTAREDPVNGLVFAWNVPRAAL